MRDDTDDDERRRRSNGRSVKKKASVLSFIPKTTSYLVSQIHEANTKTFPHASCFNLSVLVKSKSPRSQAVCGLELESAMVSDVFLSPHHWISSPSFRKQFDVTWPTLVERHRFLLTALALLALLCTVYLYFAVTLGDRRSCSSLQGAQKTLCRMELAKSTVSNGKLKFFWQMDDAQEERYCYNPKLHWNPQVEDYFIKAYGADHFSRISNALTHPSSYSCIRVNTLKSTTDAVIEKLRERLQHSEADDTKTDVINGKLPVDISKCEIPGMDYVVFVKGSGPHSIDYGYAPERPPKEVLVSRKCAEAVLRGAQVFVPGVLACSAHVEKGELVAVSVSIEQPGVDGGWGVGMTRGTILQGGQTDPYYLERKGLYIGQGTTMLSRAGIFRILKGVAVNMNNRVFNLPSFHGMLEGEIFLQNLPSIVTAHVLDPQKGERIIDMCAAPGGKTTAIAMLMKDEGNVIANDRSHNKVQDIQKLAAEFGLKCISTYKLDALKAVCEGSECNQDMEASSQSQDMDVSNSLMSQGDKVDGEGLNGHANPKENVTNEKTNEKTYVSKADIRKNMRRMKNGPGRNQTVGAKVEKSKGFLPSSFDRVLLDAPCSALGLRPRLFTAEETIESLRSHGKYQRRMFDQAVQLVRPGGVIVYSTCTINPGENEALVRYALDTHKFLSLVPQYPRIGGPGLVGRHEYPDGYIEKWLKPGEEELVQRFDPSASTDTIGFFIAKFAVGSKDSFLEKNVQDVFEES